MPALPLLQLLLLPLLLQPTAATTTVAPPRPLPCTAASTATTTTAAAATPAGGVTDFGLRLFQQFATSADSVLRTTNTLISPLSVWTVLTLAYVGAEGNTESQLRPALGLKSKEGVLTLLTGYQNSLINKTKADERISFESANRLYVDDRLSLARCREELSDYVVNLNLAGEPKKAATAINNFVNATTEGLIPSIITPSHIGPLSRMVAVSAVYFKGVWRYPFNSSRTELQPFDPLGNESKSVMVEMMSMNDAPARIGYPPELHAQVLQLPYSSGVVNITFILPIDRSSAGFRKTVTALSGLSLKNAWDSLQEDFVDIKLPKFQVKSDLDDEMIAALKALGIKDLFSRTDANLTSFGDDLYVKHFLHKTVVSVDEEGTEAAGATAAVFVTKIRKSVRLNRPFIYIIHDSDTIFFVGNYMKP